MKRARVILLAFLVLCAACTEQQSAQGLLSTCANALESNNSSLFLDQFDLKACAVHQIKNMTDDNDALHTLDKLGRTLGIGGMEDFLGSVFDVERKLRQDLGKKTSTGVLMQECSRSEQSGCPWVPASLRAADVRMVSQHAAVARVVSPTKLTTWLALAKHGDRWLIVGWAELEQTARRYAEGADTALPKGQSKKRENGTTI